MMWKRKKSKFIYSTIKAFDRTIQRQTVHLVHADFVIEHGANKIEGFTEYHRIKYGIWLQFIYIVHRACEANKHVLAKLS